MFKYLSVITNTVIFELVADQLEKELGFNSSNRGDYVRILVGQRAIIIDLVLEDKDTIYYVDVQRRLKSQGVAEFYTAAELIKGLPQTNKKEVFIIATQDIDPISQKMAHSLGIKVVKVIMKELDKERDYSVETNTIKLTTAKAWKVIFSLLEHQPTSINNIRKISGVSYGQAHRIVSYLRSRGLLNQNGDYVAISEFRPILNAVFWERPLGALSIERHSISTDLVGGVANELSDSLTRNGVKHAFTTFTAYQKYFGGISNSVIHDMYIDASNDNYHALISDLTSKESKISNLTIYRTDRDVFANTEVVDGIELVSKEQLLLDLSGGNKISIQLATDMVKQIGKV